MRRPGRSPADVRVPWRTLAPTVLVPNALQAAGQGAVISAISRYAYELTGSYAIAAVVAAMLSVGQLMTTLPAGRLVTRFGEKTTMVSSTVATALGGAGAYLAQGLALLIASVALIGAGVSVFTMARHAWITVAVPVEVRSRTLSLVSGFNRLGMLAGPFLAAVAFHLTGDVSSAFLTAVVMSVVLVGLVLGAGFPDESPVERDDAGPTVLKTMRTNRGVLARLGLVISLGPKLRLHFFARDGPSVTLADGGHGEGARRGDRRRSPITRPCHARPRLDWGATGDSLGDRGGGRGAH